MRPDTEETLRIVLARLDDMKAEDTTTIDLRGKSAIADVMVVTSGRSSRHVGSVADRVLEDLHKAGLGDVRRRREVRLADLHVNDAAPSRLERARRGLNLHDVKGRNVTHARGKLALGIHRKSECRFGKR